MDDSNTVILSGTVTDQPEPKETGQGTPYLSFQVSVGRTWNGRSGLQADETLPVACHSFARAKNAMAKYWHPGCHVVVTGRLAVRYVPQGDGSHRPELYVVAHHVGFVSPREVYENKQ